MVAGGVGRVIARTMVVFAVVAAAERGEARAEPATVRVHDVSQPTRCAEDDNVSIALSGGEVGAFSLVAEHPRYLTAGMPDQTAPDFTDCDMSGDPKFRYEKFSGVLWDDGRVKVVGYRFESDWRPTQVPVTVGDRTVVGLHLIQMFEYVDGRPIEFLVTYPSDGYWRAKPLPPTDRADTAYGTSFLVGPIEQQGRPIVAIVGLTIDPVARRYDLLFANGSRARLSVVAIDRTRAELRVEFDQPVRDGQPFAGLRSMYVTADNADAARIGWLPAPGTAWRDRPLTPGVAWEAEAVAARLWRSLPSRHNTSAPEIALRGFERHVRPAAGVAARN